MTNQGDTSAQRGEVDLPVDDDSMEGCFQLFTDTLQALAGSPRDAVAAYGDFPAAAWELKSDLVDSSALIEWMGLPEDARKAAALFGAVAGSDEATLVGIATRGLGFATVYDGVNGIATSVDGKERMPALEEFGGSLLGPQGAEIGRIVSNGTTLRSGLRSVRRMMSGRGSAKDAFDTTKASRDAASSQAGPSDPCPCPK